LQPRRAAEQGAGSASEVQGPVDPSELSGTLDVWGFGTEDPVGEVRVKAFEKAFPNVEVKLTPGDFDEQKFLSAVAAGNPPDVVHIDRGLVGSYAARGALVALDDYVTASELDLGVYLPAALEQVQLDGATYGLPEFNNVIVAYLNNGAPMPSQSSGGLPPGAATPRRPQQRPRDRESASRRQRVLSGATGRSPRRRRRWHGPTPICRTDSTSRSSSARPAAATSSARAPSPTAPPSGWSAPQATVPAMEPANSTATWWSCLATRRAATAVVTHHTAAGRHAS